MTEMQQEITRIIQESRARAEEYFHLTGSIYFTKEWEFPTEVKKILEKDRNVNGEYSLHELIKILEEEILFISNRFMRSIVDARDKDGKLMYSNDKARECELVMRLQFHEDYAALKEWLEYFKAKYAEAMARRELLDRLFRLDMRHIDMLLGTKIT